MKKIDKKKLIVVVVIITVVIIAIVGVCSIGFNNKEDDQSKENTKMNETRPYLFGSVYYYKELINDDLKTSSEEEYQDYQVGDFEIVNSTTIENQNYNLYETQLIDNFTIQLVVDSSVAKIVQIRYIVTNFDLASFSGYMLGSTVRLLNGNLTSEEINNYVEDLDVSNLAAGTNNSIIFKDNIHRIKATDTTIYYYITVNDNQESKYLKLTHEVAVNSNETNDSNKNTSENNTSTNTNTSDNNTANNNSNNTTNNNTSTNNNTNTNSNVNTNTNTNNSVSTSKQNALKKAKSYLNSNSFSYEGLIHQLEYEKFTSEQAKYGADNCGANWNEQAVKKAKSYLNSNSFSYESLIHQLEYEKFTHEQAVYGADNCGASW